MATPEKYEMDNSSSNQHQQQEHQQHSSTSSDRNTQPIFSAYDEVSAIILSVFNKHRHMALKRAEDEKYQQELLRVLQTSQIEEELETKPKLKELIIEPIDELQKELDLMIKNFGSTIGDSFNTLVDNYLINDSNRKVCTKQQEIQIEIPSDSSTDTLDDNAINLEISISQHETQGGSRGVYERSCGLHWSTIIANLLDPASNYHFIWLMLVAVTVLYNMVFVSGRGVFWKLNNSIPITWMILDRISDVIYVLDTVIHAHEGFMDHGIIIHNYQKARANYFKTFKWKYDFLSLFPTDIINFWWLRGRCSAKVLPCPVIVRLTRLFRIPRMIEFCERFRIKTYYPNTFRICKMLIAIFIFIHWYSCVYFITSYVIGFGSDKWVYNLQGSNETFYKQYIYCFYWSTFTLAIVGEMPLPQTPFERVYVVLNVFADMIIFAAFVGNILHMITHRNTAKEELQKKIESVKQYLATRRVSREFEARVMKRLAYIWNNQQVLNDEKVLKILPINLRNEIAINIHLEFFKKIDLLKQCDHGVFAEIIPKLKLLMFNPGDHICHKGEIGYDIYIVKEGIINVVEEDQTTVLATFATGSIFGEVSVLEIAGNEMGNRRISTVRSHGYSEIFALSKENLWTLMINYPIIKNRLMEHACNILRYNNLLNEEIYMQSQIEEEPIHKSIAKLESQLSEIRELLWGMSSHN